MHMYIVIMYATIRGLLKRVDFTIQEVNCSLRKVLGGRNEGFSGDCLQTSVYCRFFENFSSPSSMSAIHNRNSLGWTSASKERPFYFLIVHPKLSALRTNSSNTEPESMIRTRTFQHPARCSLRVRGEQEAAEGGLSVLAQTLVTTNISSSPQRSHSRPHSRLSSCPGRQCAR